MFGRIDDGSEQQRQIVDSCTPIRASDRHTIPCMTLYIIQSVNYEWGGCQSLLLSLHTHTQHINTSIAAANLVAMNIFLLIRRHTTFVYAWTIVIQLIKHVSMLRNIGLYLDCV